MFQISVFSRYEVHGFLYPVVSPTLQRHTQTPEDRSHYRKSVFVRDKSKERSSPGFYPQNFAPDRPDLIAQNLGFCLLNRLSLPFPPNSSSSSSLPCTDQTLHFAIAEFCAKNFLQKKRFRSTSRSGNPVVTTIKQPLR